MPSDMEFNPHLFYIVGIDIGNFGQKTFIINTNTIDIQDIKNQIDKALDDKDYAKAEELYSKNKYLLMEG